VEGQTVEVAGEIGECEFRLGPRQTDGADEGTEAGLLVSEDVLEPRV